MRCIDDVKDSVRQAALSLVRALTSFSVRVCDLTCNSLQVISQPVNVVVPLLISQASNAEAVEVKAVSLSCLFSVVKVIMKETLMEPLFWQHWFILYTGMYSSGSRSVEVLFDNMWQA